MNSGGRALGEGLTGRWLSLRVQTALTVVGTLAVLAVLARLVWLDARWRWQAHVG